VTRRLPITAILLTAAFAFSACGGEKGEVERAETEGVQVTVGDLQYQVQVSRQLNPAQVEDRDLLKGVPVGEQELDKGSEWFAVFVQVRNNRDEPIKSASDFVIEDTIGTEFEPIEVDSALAYEQQTIEGESILPAPDSVQSSFNTKGAMLLFKVTQAALENRPLEFIIKDPADPSKTAVVDLVV
jgi:hypothetical protein